MVRDHFMANFFGTGLVASAFSIAYRLPNMFRNLLAEGTLSQSFMPIFSDYEKQGIEEARSMTGIVLVFLASCLCIFVLLFMLVSPFVLPLLVGGSEEYQSLVVELSLILFVIILTTSLSSIFMSISNSKKKFFVPALSPILLNLSYICVFLFVFPFFSNEKSKIFALSFGIVSGAILQLVVQGYFVYKLGYFPRFQLQCRHPAIRKIVTLMLPAAIGGSFYQIGLLVDIFLANYIQNHYNISAVVSLDYAQRLVQLPTGIIGVAISTTILPSLLNSLKENDSHSIQNEIVDSLSFGLFLTLPAAIGMFFASTTILDSIYFGGKWNHASTEITTIPLMIYALAIPFYSCNKILISCYYAHKDTKTPLRIQMYTFTCGILISILLMGMFLHSAIALASLVSTVITFICLLSFLQKHGIFFSKFLFLKRISAFFIPIFVIGAMLYAVERIFRNEIFSYIGSFSTNHAASSRILIFIEMSIAIGLYFMISTIFKIPEVKVFIYKKRKV